MQKSTFKIAKMDCPSEEQVIRMKLADITNINSLDFDIANRKLVVFHTGKYDEIFQRLDTLKLDTSLLESIAAGEVVLPENHAQERKLLWQVLGINLFFFVLESISGIVA
ncbi:MAG TPA: hypothetical protein VK872_17030, partial [Draconibacterium sp.]|nr:hypothetical protein [Draconibacterium sp.]